MLGTQRKYVEVVWLSGRFNIRCWAREVKRLDNAAACKSSRAAMIRPCGAHEFDIVWTIINDGARAYHGIIPADCLKHPYMAKSELEHEINDGVVFWVYEDSGELLGVMGIQELGDVTLIRHAYVLTSAQGRGIGSKLLLHLRKLARKPLLIGTWADANRAIGFYEKHGFRLLAPQDTDRLLPKYWKISRRQAETSVVLASPEWLSSESA